MSGVPEIGKRGAFDGVVPQEKYAKKNDTEERVETAVQPLVQAQEEPEDVIAQLKRIQATTIFSHEPSTNTERLFIACKIGYKLAIAVLLAMKTDINEQIQSGFTPLMLTCCVGDKVCIERLLDVGAVIDFPGAKAVRPINAAIKSDRLEAVQMLLERGAKVNCVDDFLRTPLWWACSYGRTRIVEVLLEKGANINMLEKSGASSLSIAINRGHQEIASILKEKGAKILNTSLFKNEIEGNGVETFSIDEYLMELAQSIKTEKEAIFQNLQSEKDWLAVLGRVREKGGEVSVETQNLLEELDQEAEQLSQSTFIGAYERNMRDSVFLEPISIPVFDLESPKRHCWELASIQQAVSSNPRSPATRSELRQTHLHVNEGAIILSAIYEFLKKEAA